MFKRMRYQQGCLTRERRKIGPDELAAQRKLIDTIVPKTQQPTILTGLNS